MTNVTLTEAELPPNTGRVKRYDWQKIIDMYEAGASLPEIQRALGSSATNSRRIIIASGKRTRTCYEATAVTWHKLCRVNKGKTRLISIPSTLLEKLSVDPDKDLRGKWMIQRGRLSLIVEEAAQ